MLVVLTLSITHRYDRGSPVVRQGADINAIRSQGASLGALDHRFGERSCCSDLCHTLWPDLAKGQRVGETPDPAWH